MPLASLNLAPPQSALPDRVARYLKQSEPLIARHRTKLPLSFRGFVPSDYVGLYWALSHIRAERLACGDLFCEWGSGLGMATCLASLLGYDAYGIEIDEELWRVSVECADEFSIPAQFVCGSFLPPGVDGLVDEAYAENDGRLSLVADADEAYAELDHEIRDFDVVFTFPWPDDEQLVESLFDEYASVGALLLTYSEDESFRLWRKT